MRRQVSLSLRRWAAVFRDLSRHRWTSAVGGPSGTRGSILGRIARCRIPEWLTCSRPRRFPDDAAIGEQLDSLTPAARMRSLKDILFSAFPGGLDR